MQIKETRWKKDAFRNECSSGRIKELYFSWDGEKHILQIFVSGSEIALLSMAGVKRLLKTKRAMAEKMLNQRIEDLRILGNGFNS